jgi:hypothetical protein
MIAAEQPDLFMVSWLPNSSSVSAARDAALAKLQENAGELFMAKASAFVASYLAAHGSASGEDITDACKAAGIVPHCDKAFGAVYLGLSRKGIIEKAGYCERRKGNGTAGGILWRLK